MLQAQLIALGILKCMLYTLLDRYVWHVRISTIAKSLIKITEIPEGFGRHIYIFAPADRVGKTRVWLRDLFVFELFFHIATTLSKIAVYVLYSSSFPKLYANLPLAATRLTFYYRIFPILHFRRMFICVGIVSLLYMVSIEFTVIFQWYADAAPLLSLQRLIPAVIPFTTPGIGSTQIFMVTASTLMLSSLVAAPLTSLLIL